MKAKNIVNIKDKSIENKINSYKQICNQLKVLEAQKNQLKESLVNAYFETHEEYKDKDGLVLATYKSQVRTLFNQSKFKQDNPKIYDDYCDEQKVNVFLVK